MGIQILNRCTLADLKEERVPAYKTGLDAWEAAGWIEYNKNPQDPDGLEAYRWNILGTNV